MKILKKMLEKIKDQIDLINGMVDVHPLYKRYVETKSRRAYNE